MTKSDGLRKFPKTIFSKLNFPISKRSKHEIYQSKIKEKREILIKTHDSGQSTRKKSSGGKICSSQRFANDFELYDLRVMSPAA